MEFTTLMHLVKASELGRGGAVTFTGGDWISAQEVRALLLLVCPQKFSVTARGGVGESKIGLCVCLALELQGLSIRTRLY